MIILVITFNHMSGMMSIVTDLVALRKEKGLTQAQLAALAGLSRMTVSKVEQQDVVDPQLSTLEAVARALGVEFVVVPRELRDTLESFIRSGGRLLAQPAGSAAPPSVVDQLLSRP